MTVELLAPAGNLEKLRTALNYGADAVYAGGERFSLRARAGNLTLADLSRARDDCRRLGRRIYLTLNAFLRPGEEEDVVDYLKALRPLELDAYIVADPGMLELIRRHDPHRPVHLSTQASTSTAGALRFWHRAGIRRVNLARELSLSEIRALDVAGTGVELEAFVHGAMCIAWSGRCLLSAAMTGRSANRGSCTQPCRWRYALVEETRPGAVFPLEEDGRGSYLFNSRDLCLLEQLPELLGAGVSALKIEGRMKSVHYVAAVTRVYRAALDRWLRDPAGWRCEPAWREELERVSHRPYGTGFFLGAEGPQTHPADARYRRGCDFLGVVEGAGEAGQVAVRGRFTAGESLELIGPGMRSAFLVVEGLRDAAGEPLTAARPNMRVTLKLPAASRPGDILRRVREDGG